MKLETFRPYLPWITLLVLVLIVGGMNPVVHYRNMGEALLMAFSTSSSSATLPRSATART